MGNKEQTKWSESYVMFYSHDKTYQNREEVFICFVIKYFLRKSIGKIFRKVTFISETFPRELVKDGRFVVQW